MHEYLTDLCNVYELAAWSCALHVCTKLHSLSILALTLQGTNIVEICNLSPIVKVACQKVAHTRKDIKVKVNIPKRKRVCSLGILAYYRGQIA